ncbi:MAG: hypothetical protein ACREUU_12745 [Gammaproteobacteria bacterium]
MNSQGYDWEKPPRISVSSIILLAIHIFAALFLAYMIWARPWDNEPSTVAAPSPPAAEAPAPTVPAPVPPDPNAAPGP